MFFFDFRFIRIDFIVDSYHTCTFVVRVNMPGALLLQEVHFLRLKNHLAGLSLVVSCFKSLVICHNFTESEEPHHKVESFWDIEYLRFPWGPETHKLE